MSHMGTLLGFAVTIPMVILSIRIGGIRPDMLLWTGCMFVYGLGVVNYAHAFAGMFLAATLRRRRYIMLERFRMS